MLIPVFIGFAGMGVDISFWQYSERRVQTAADISAFAGAVALRNGLSVSDANAVALEEAAQLGFTALVDTIDTNSPPLSGANINKRAMEVRIRHQTSRFFSQIYSSDPVMLNARAVAAYNPPQKACLLSLNTEASGGLTFSGAADVKFIACEVMSNSIASDAVVIGGSAGIEVPCVNSVGQYAISGNGVAMSLTGCPEPRTDLPPAQDPYKDVPEPNKTVSCTSIESGTGIISVAAGLTGARKFCGGLSLTKDYHFEPGVYIIDGGDFRINSGAHISGDGVTFFLTNGAEIKFNGNATIDISAPVTGTYSGIAFFGDPADKFSQHVFNGTASSSITGSIYTPASKISYLGNFSGENGCLQLVGGTVRVSGTVNIQTDCMTGGIKWAQVPSDVRLVE